MSKFTFKDLAEKVLKEERKPLTGEVIWAIARQNGYDKLGSFKGNFSWKSIRLMINRDILKNKYSVFVRIYSEPRKFFLREFLSEEDLNEIKEKRKRDPYRKRRKSNIKSIGSYPIEKGMLIQATSEVISHYLELYLEDTKDFHGYTAIIYKNPSSDIDEQRKVVQSFLTRANELSEDKSLADQSIERQIGMGSLKSDMRDSGDFHPYKDLHLVRWYMVNTWHGFLAVSGFFMICVWWWTFILMMWIREM